MTIYDIAKSCGVSIATVSRVLNGSDKVRPATRAKILAAMDEQNYSPNPFARGLGLNSMKMIGILCTDISDTFYAKAVALVEHRLKEKGLDVILGCTGDKLEDKKKYLQWMLDKHVDAILLIGSPFRESRDNSHIAMVAEKVPIIAINCLFEYPDVFCVLCDETAGIKDAAEKLIKNKRTSILYLYDQLTYSGRQKLNGLELALKENNIKADNHLIVSCARNFTQINNTINKLIKNDLTFSAVIASEDILAVGAQKALRENNINIPVIGCNNSILAECASPSLTSLDNRLDILCPTAVDIITSIIHGDKDSIPSKTIFPPILVERESFRA